MKFAFLICLSFSSFKTSHALEHKGCSDFETIALADQNLPPIRDQDSIGYCASYAAADLYEQYLKKHHLITPESSVSAMGAALSYYSETEAFDRAEQEIGQHAKKVHKFSPVLAEEEQKLAAQIKELDRLKRSESILETDFSKNQILKEKEKIRESISKTKHRINFLKHSLKLSIAPHKKGGAIPEGAFSSYVLESLIDNFCFESEIPSDLNSYGQDNFLALIAQFFFDHALIKKENMAQCDQLLRFQQMFPGIPLSSRKDLLQLIKKAPPKQVMAYYLQKSCSPKKIAKRPKIKRVWNLFLSDSKFARSIEDQLKTKAAVAITMNNKILKQENDIDSWDKDSSHVLSVVGHLKGCGKEYYKVRNSWGKKACSMNSFEFQFNREHKRFKTLEEQFSNNCKSIPLDDPDNYLTASVCMGRVEKEKKRLGISPPFFCDDEGYYYLEKDLLIKSSREAFFLKD
jgi:hypothetical protein